MIHFHYLHDHASELSNLRWIQFMQYTGPVNGAISIKMFACMGFGINLTCTY